MKRATADTNILISAFLRGGKPLQLLDLARAGQIELAVSDAILSEMARVLVTKFGVPLDEVQAFGDQIKTFAKHVTPSERLDAVKADPTDNPILECAIAARSEVVVTGDKHLLLLGRFRTCEILTVSDFLARGPVRTQ